MLSGNQVKYLHSLRLGKFRELHREFTAEGIKLAEELLNSRFTVKHIFAVSEWFERNGHLAIAHDVPVQEITHDELKRISNLVTPNEVLLVVEIPDEKWPGNDDTGKLTLALDRIQDPGNLGTIIRTADWFGIRHIFCSHGTADVFNPKVVQATMGSISRVHLHYGDLGSFLQEMEGIRTLYGAFADGKSIYQFEPKYPATVIIGNESQGISGEIVQYLDEKIGIPSFGSGVESLNASVATAIICSEFCRRLL